MQIIPVFVSKKHGNRFWSIYGIFDLKTLNDIVLTIRYWLWIATIHSKNWMIKISPQCRDCYRFLLSVKSVNIQRSTSPPRLWMGPFNHIFENFLFSPKFVHMLSTFNAIYFRIYKERISENFAHALLVWKWNFIVWND